MNLIWKKRKKQIYTNMIALRELRELNSLLDLGSFF